ncbi:EamA family transporter RarD [Marinicauda algicola]|uniref:EamA family transporter RarD n=1 Tax=Marinicauda algicola TaxID=2029849 RepID=A0A4S2H088_9PROT|nr:EamA family transporter RarD [Marinicauda algicola]TGY88937.1 EamA family transporter RarD [Marinicauda algicola]
MNTPPDSTRLDPVRAGVTALSGYLIWGLSPLFYKLLGFAGASEIVLHRAVWSVPALALLLYLGRRMGPALRLLADRRAMAILLVTALLIGANWWTFIFAVNAGRVLEVSLGYFINPLMNVAVGVFVARERFGPLRGLAVGLAAIGVANQILVVGSLPLIALFLAASFTAYGYLRKTIATDGRVGLFWETVIIAVPSLAALAFLETGGQGHFTDGWWPAFLLVMTGPMTVAPLLLFIIGARGLHFATIGILQFVAPTLQFAIGLATGEPFTPMYLLTFVFIWAGLAVFVLDLLSFARKQRRAKV